MELTQTVRHMPLVQVSVSTAPAQPLSYCVIYIHSSDVRMEPSLGTVILSATVPFSVFRWGTWGTEESSLKAL